MSLKNSPQRPAQEAPKKFIPKPRKPRMDARTYKQLFIRREVQVFKAQGDQVVRSVVQVSKTQDQEPQEEMDGLRIPNKDLADLTPHFVWSKAEMLQLMKQMTKGRKDNLFLRKHCRHMMLAQPAQYVMEAGNKRLSV